MIKFDFCVRALFSDTSSNVLKVGLSEIEAVFLQDLVNIGDKGFFFVRLLLNSSDAEARVRDVVSYLGFEFCAKMLYESLFFIEGMSCVSCSSRIETHIIGVRGVVSGSVNFATMSAVVVHDANVVTAAELRSEIVQLGYKVTLRGTSSSTSVAFTGVHSREVQLLIGGMSCTSCAARVESMLHRIDGVVDCVVNFSTGVCKVVLDDEGVLERIEESILLMGYTVCVMDNVTDLVGVHHTREALERTREISEHKKKLIGAAFLSSPLILFMLLMATTQVLDDPTTMLFVDGLQLAVTTPIVVYYGSGFFSRAWRSLLHGVLTMDTLVAIGAGSSFLYSLVAYTSAIQSHRHVVTYFDTAGMLLVFMLLGRYLEAHAKRSTSDALIQLMNLVPPNSIVLTQHGDVTVPSSSIAKGMLVRVLAGDRIPVDGIVMEGMSDVDEQFVTGEVVPRAVKPGSQVVGGTANVTAMLVVEASKIGEETMLSQILRVVQEAQNSKPSIQRIADEIAAYFVPFVIAFSLMVFLIWFLLGTFEAYPLEWRGSGESTVTFSLDFFIASVVAACPCALGLATPTAIMVGTGVGAKNGVLVKSGKTLEVVRRSRCVVFDKTGTITRGRLQVVFKECLCKDADLVMKAVWVVEQHSTHPVAKAVAAGILHAEKNMVYSVISSKTHSGLGTEAVIQNKENGKQMKVHVGNMELMRQCGVEVPLEVQRMVQCQVNLGRTTVVGAVDGVGSVVVALSDDPRDEALGVVSFLQNLHFRVLLVTGDNKCVAARVARDVGISNEDVYAESLPTTKADIVRDLQLQGHRVIFVGDGINDSPALAQADVGVALGAGTEIAIEAADAVLVRNNLVDLLNLHALSVTTVRRVYGNFVWAFSYNLIMLPFAGGLLYPILRVKLPPVVAGAAMVMSSLSVLLSSLSIYCFKPYKSEMFTHAF